jgi:hypothetical protein
MKKKSGIRIRIYEKSWIRIRIKVIRIRITVMRIRNPDEQNLPRE